MKNIFEIQNHRTVLLCIFQSTNQRREKCLLINELDKEKKNHIILRSNIHTVALQDGWCCFLSACTNVTDASFSNWHCHFCWCCSPSGCTFWGKKPWSRTKKILWQLGTLVGAPVGISLLASIAVPAMIIGIPIWVGRKVKHAFTARLRSLINL